MTVVVSVRSGVLDACLVQITPDSFAQSLNYPGLEILLIRQPV